MSVVIPTRNRVELLARAVASVHDPEVEVVIVDDGSTDGTASLVGESARPNLRLVRLPRSRGPCEARNRGVAAAGGDLIVFLDDDDELLPDGVGVIQRVARRAPQFDLYLHNCVYPDARTSIDPTVACVSYSYADWLAGRFDAELKPVVRRGALDADRFDDTGAGGEGLLWGRMLRRGDALVNGTPVIRYDTARRERLTSAAELLARAPANAAIAERWLQDFGDDLLVVRRDRWHDRKLAAFTYLLACGRASEARAHLDEVPADLMTRPRRSALVILSHLPPQAVRLLFLAHRRELVGTMASRRLRRALAKTSC